MVLAAEQFFSAVAVAVLAVPLSSQVLAAALAQEVLLPSAVYLEQTQEKEQIQHGSDHVFRRLLNFYRLDILYFCL